MSSPSVRLLGAGNFDLAVALFSAQLRDHGIDTPIEDLMQVVQTIVAQPQFGFILLARSVEGTPVGVAYASSLLSLEHGGISGWLEELYVLPESRGLGIGSLLVAEVIAHAQELGWKALDLEVDVRHQRAISLYARFQFKPHSRCRFYRPLLQ